MKAPFNPRVKDPRKAFQANEDPAVVERAWSKIAGEDRKGVDEEVLWLAVTHKSFDQGRRGFNDRLAFLGMLIF
jgi:large subunit ribosomal protein L15